MEAIRVLAENPSGSMLQHAKTNEVLSRLLDNLRREQCALSEQHYLVFRMLLSATQVPGPLIWSHGTAPGGSPPRDPLSQTEVLLSSPLCPAISCFIICFCSPAETALSAEADFNGAVGKRRG
jgi:hypothetical protein